MTSSHCDDTLKIQMVMEGEVPDTESSDAAEEENVTAR